MKFTWGTGILLFYVFFAASMTCAVVATTQHPPQLMQQDYYALDLNYQERLDKKQNAAALPAVPTVRFNADAGVIEVRLPAGMTAQKGSVKCYRSATTRDDVSVPLEGTSGLNVPAAGFAPGRWHVELDWQATGGEAYFWETAIVIAAR